MFNVVNKRDYRGPGEFIGRPSVLGNPFIIGRDGNRDEVIAKYRTWLWSEIKKRGEVYDELLHLAKLDIDGEVTLVCYCKPLPCHGDVIAKAIEWLKTNAEAARSSHLTAAEVAEFNSLRGEEAKLNWVRSRFDDVNPYLEDDIRDDPGILDAHQVILMQNEWPATQKRM